jgi:hypothetical protein
LISSNSSFVGITLYSFLCSVLFARHPDALLDLISQMRHSLRLRPDFPAFLLGPESFVLPRHRFPLLLQVLARVFFAELPPINPCPLLI